MKIASAKNAKPSSVNDSPSAPPYRAMKAGQSSPNSNESTVPDTAPTANSTANARDHLRASANQTGSPVRTHLPST